MNVQLLIQEDGAGDFELLGKPMEYGEAQRRLFDTQVSQVTNYRLRGESYYANCRIRVVPLPQRLPVNSRKNQNSQKVAA